ncbi:hypothetical protein DICVIV_06787 [Dictyocaulus viviparus]|uniref:Uncharacterized protein n=1 Tax=Dictyocaulus viviparus TaxID=29172 RepID=A0A0D8XXQ4_DICVI|nr:hypothetical protein DICVIV_06787 [Dictyocaulus viviparus]
MMSIAGVLDSLLWNTHACAIGCLAGTGSVLVYLLKYLISQMASDAQFQEQMKEVYCFEVFIVLQVDKVEKSEVNIHEHENSKKEVDNIKESEFCAQEKPEKRSCLVDNTEEKEVHAEAQKTSKKERKTSRIRSKRFTGFSCRMITRQSSKDVKEALFADFSLKDISRLERKRTVRAARKGKKQNDDPPSTSAEPAHKKIMSEEKDSAHPAETMESGVAPPTDPVDCTQLEE